MTRKRAELLHAFPVNSDPEERHALGFDSCLDVEVRFPGQRRGFQARLRDPRGGSCFLDVGNSLFTLAYRDVLEHLPPGDGTRDVVVLRPGALATHVVPRMARRSGRERAAARVQPTPAADRRAPRDEPVAAPAEEPTAVLYAEIAD